MEQTNWKLHTTLLVVGAISILAGCSSPVVAPPPRDPVVSAPAPREPVVTAPPPRDPVVAPPPAPAPSTNGKKPVSEPGAVSVLVNKVFLLPSDYRPDDLVEPKVPFIFKEQDEKRLMRAEAARALEQMFSAAKQDGISLAGVSGFRSYETQKSLFSYYVRTQGEEVARKYSAEPGHSEHQTGLAMDVSGSTGKCAVEDCFADTPEAKWLAKRAPEFGFIIRYPKGKEEITGYFYEPWHLRYVGRAVSKAIAEKNVTLEEYMGAVR